MKFREKMYLVVEADVNDGYYIRKTKIIDNQKELD
jgi:hypothetical protein